jgi:hypothetical protein
MRVLRRRTFLARHLVNLPPVLRRRRQRQTPLSKFVSSANFATQAQRLEPLVSVGAPL